MKRTMKHIITLYRRWTTLPSHSIISSFSHSLILSFSLLLLSCSETKNLAEGETLYTGIKRVIYDKPQSLSDTPDTTGVIKAIGDAYNTVSDYLKGEEKGRSQVPSDGGENIQSDSLSANVNTPSLRAGNGEGTAPSLKLDKAAYSLAKSEVEGVLAYSPNNSLMGSSYYRQPLAIGLWMWNRYVNSKSRFGRWMFNTFAATPITLTSVNPRVRTQVAQNTLHSFGYFRGTASFDTIPSKHPRKAKVSYAVHPGPLFHLDSIAYLGFPQQADSIIHATKRLTTLHPGAPFSVVDLDEERTRLSKAFRNNGYYYFRPEHIVYRADTVARPLFVQLQAIPSPNAPDEARQQYVMGRTLINVYQYDDHEIVDTLRRPQKLSWRTRRAIARYQRQHPQSDSARNVRRTHAITMAYSGTPGHTPLKLRALSRFISYRPGDLYKLHVQEAMQNNLASMGIFSQVNVRLHPQTPSEGGEYMRPDSLSTNVTTPSPQGENGERGVLDVDITLRLDKPYDAEFRGNIATKSNGLVGPGVNFSMSKQNVFRGAEKLSLEAYGSYEWMTGAQTHGKHSLMNSYEWGTSINLTYPRLLLLGLGYRFNRRAQSTTSYKINADWLNRSGYFSRVSFGARVTHTYQRNRRYMHEVVPIRLDYEKQLHTTAKFDSIALTNQALYASLRDQFVPSAQYTFTHTNPASRDRKRRITLSIKEAGNLTSLVYRMAGKPFDQRDKSLFGVPFAQYIRFTAEATQQMRLGQTHTFLVGRFYAGIIHSFGNAATAPYADLFTVGGANSIRAFGVRTIGPGSYHPANSNYSYIDQMGDLKFEANLEYRFPLVSKLGGALFVDAGNVWLMHRDPERPGGSLHLGSIGREIALGTGFGLRYDLDFLVIRFDVGVGIHAPYNTGKSGYYNMTKFWDSLGFHLAVGYPF